MHFFLDSTLFQNGKDVFLKNRYSQEFLNICRQQNFKIYISTVVIDEIRRQYHGFISSQLKNIRTAIGAFNIIPRIRPIQVTYPEIEEAMYAFEQHFKNLQEEGIVQIVTYSNDFLPELIHRSIYRIKPFTESKQEFRDAIIWFSYAQLAEEQQFENCYLITGNTTDYLTKDGQLYDALAEKSRRFILYKDVYTLLNASFMEPYKTTHALLSTLKQKEWNKDLILDFLKQDYIKSYILKRIIDDFEGTSAEELWDETYHPHRIVSIVGISDPTRPSIRGIDFINKEFIVIGSFQVEVQFVSSRKNESTSIMTNLYPGKEELHIFFDAVFNPQSNTFNNLEISSYENASSYWQGVQRVSQDSY